VTTFAPADPIWTPPEASDTRRAWVKGNLRVEAAALYGRLVYFEIISPARTVDTGGPTPQRPSALAGGAAGTAFMVGVTLFAAFVARRNVRLGRGDSRGAWRLAGLFLAFATAADLVSANSTAALLQIWGQNFALKFFPAAWIWIGYLAIEPYVRRLWPQALVTWTRLLEGRFRDPRVGRDLLVGGATGMVAVAILNLPQAAVWFGLPPPTPVGSGRPALGGTAHLVAALLGIPMSSFIIPVGILLVLLIARLIFKRPWLAYPVAVAAVALVLGAGSDDPLNAAARVLILVLATVILTRLGVFAMMVTIAFSSWGSLPLTIDPASWYFPYSLISILLFAAIAVYGFIIALGDRLTFKDSVLD
jgi:hypothetical protein